MITYCAITKYGKSLAYFMIELNLIVAFKRYALHHLFSVCERPRHFYSVYAHVTTHPASVAQVSSFLSASACVGPCMLLLRRFLSLIRLSLFLQGYTQLHLYFLALLATSSCFASSLHTSRPACIVSPASVEVATCLAASCT